MDSLFDGLIIQSTLDVPEESIEKFCVAIQADFSIEKPHQGRIGQFSAAPPSWINVISNASWWQQLLGLAATAYIVEIAREAAKDTWKSKARVLRAAVGTANAVAEFATRLSGLKKQVPSRTELAIALPEPDDYFTAKLVLTASDPDVLTLEIALFVHHLSGLSSLIERNRTEGEMPQVGYFLQLTGNGDLLVSWMNPTTGAKVVEKLAISTQRSGGTP